MHGVKQSTHTTKNKIKDGQREKKKLAWREGASSQQNVYTIAILGEQYSPKAYQHSTVANNNLRLNFALDMRKLNGIGEGIFWFGISHALRTEVHQQSLEFCVENCHAGALFKAIQTHATQYDSIYIVMLTQIYILFNVAWGNGVYHLVSVLKLQQFCHSNPCRCSIWTGRSYLD